MRSACFIFLLLICSAITGFSQSTETSDTLKTQQLDEVVVTATRNERTVGALPMPVTLVKKEMIKSMGSVRLNDVLTEQTGLVVVPQINGQGNGIQVQGFDPDYTLILVDGEPIVGRYTGSLELSRLSVGNIKQIEIVKGPSSSLYGSDALAGVINIITERPVSNQAELSIRTGAIAARGKYIDLTDSKTTDINASGSIVHKNLGVYLFGNGRISDGYDLSPANSGKTVSPFTNYTLGTKINYSLSTKTDVSLAARYFSEVQNYGFSVLSNGNSIPTTGQGDVKDWSINPIISHRVNSNLKLTARYYTTHYSTNTELKRISDSQVTYTDNFKQSFSRYELIGEYAIDDKNTLTTGIGHVGESVVTSRYNDQLERAQQTDYAFLQYEILPTKSITIVSGLRYDNNSVFGNQLSPKFSARYEINKSITVKGSFGLGFKSPDFRQLYLNFANQAAGYIVLGTEVISSKFKEYEAQGLIVPGSVDLTQFTGLKPERSISFNLGGDVKLTEQLNLSANVFYNLVDNLIDSRIVTTNTLGKNIFSYVNVNKAVMKGIESDITYRFSSLLSLSVGYQLLYAFDRDVYDLVADGKKFWKDPITNETAQLTTSEYFGLYNRSRHSGNVKLFYQDNKKGIEGSLRVIYRGKFGIGGISGNIQGEDAPSSERNGNGLLDDYDFFVDGYALVNLSVAKKINQFRVQVGVDNLFDYTQPVYLPNIPGRLSYVSLGFTIN